MKIFGIVVKIVAALAAIAGIAFVVVKYGDKIVAWFKKVFGDLFYCECDCNCDCDCENCDCEGECEECDCDCCECCEEAPAEEAEEGAVVAAEADFEG